MNDNRQGPASQAGDAVEARTLDREQGIIAVPVQDDLARIDQTMLSIEKGIDAFKKVKITAMRLTKEKDWIDMGGRPYLDDGGTTNIAIAFGVDIYDIKLSPIQWHEDKKGQYYSFDATGTGMSRRLGRMVQDIGTCSSRDKFFSMVRGQLKQIEDIDMANVKKKAVTNLMGRLIKRLVGIGSVDFEDLKEAGLDISKITKVEYKKPEPQGDSPKDQDPQDPQVGADSKPLQRPQDRTAAKPRADEKTLDQIRAICTIMAGPDIPPERVLQTFSSFTGTDGKPKDAADFSQLTAGWAGSVLKRLKDAWANSHPNEQLPTGMKDVR